MQNSEEELNFLVYGIVFPVVLAVGIIGSLCNLVVLNLLMHKAPCCYTYMRGMSVCDLLMLLASIPFIMRMTRGENLPFSSFWIAWYFAHLDLYLSNAFATAGAFLLVALTAERYAAFCHPLTARSWQLATASIQSRRRCFVSWMIVALAALVYAPFVYQYTVVRLQVPAPMTANSSNATTTPTPSVHFEYAVVDDETLLHNDFYETYNVFKEFVSRIAPTVLLALMNFSIVRKHRRASCHFRRSSRFVVVSQREQRRLHDGRRLAIILGGMSLKFTVCTVPAAVLAITMDDGRANLDSYSYDLFRATANTLELLKNSTTFLVFYLCSADYRRHFRRCFRSADRRPKSASSRPRIVVGDGPGPPSLIDSKTLPL